ncbi:MAG: restriction endonuclease subunit S [Pseudomonadales bacterium]|nr:restriction endonuclease subunit S [Pseudomonadales bacterium]
MKELITANLDIWSAAVTAKTNGAGRSSGNNKGAYGINRLRELILELAVRGKLVPQDPSDEPASELLKKIRKEKDMLIAEGKIKKVKPLPPITEEEKPFDLPVRWEWVKLGDVLLKLTDGTHHSPTNVDNGEFKYISAKNIKPWGIDLSEITYVTRDVHQEIYGRCDPAFGDLLYIKDGATTGVATINTLEEQFSMLSSVALLKPSTGTYNQFLLKAITSPLFYSEMRSEMTGVAITRVTLAKLNNAIVPLPPKNEQHRIVAKVDELMALCDQLEAEQADSAHAHEKLVSVLLDALTQGDDISESWVRIQKHFDALFTTPTSVDKLKQTLLQLAVMGKLVPQDPNDEPASELLKKIRKEKDQLIAEGKIKKDRPLPPIADEDKPFVLPDGWEWVSIDWLSELITSGSRDWAKYLAEHGAKFITMGNLSKGSYELRLDKMRYVTPPSNGEGSRTKLEENDVVISITGDVGNLGRIPTGFGEAYINQHACLLRFLPSCRGRYFPELLRSPLAVAQFNAPQRGIKNSFRLSDVYELIVPLPPYSEQQRIVDKVDELMALCDQLKAHLVEAGEQQRKVADVMVERAVC